MYRISIIEISVEFSWIAEIKVNDHDTIVGWFFTSKLGTFSVYSSMLSSFSLTVSTVKSPAEKKRDPISCRPRLLNITGAL